MEGLYVHRIVYFRLFREPQDFSHRIPAVVIHPVDFNAFAAYLIIVPHAFGRRDLLIPKLLKGISQSPLEKKNPLTFLTPTETISLNVRFSLNR